MGGCWRWWMRRVVVSCVPIALTHPDTPERISGKDNPAQWSLLQLGTEAHKKFFVRSWLRSCN